MINLHNVVVKVMFRCLERCIAFLGGVGIKVAVGVLTFRRPQGLKRLLSHLARQEFFKTKATFEVFVVDNDPGGSASSIIQGTRANFPVPIHYFLETRRGISFGRNRCIEESIRQGFDVLAFIDDDEIPDKLWLDELLAALEQYGCDVVAGPVLSSFEDGPPVWILRGGFFNRKRFRTGTERDRVGTGNVAFRVEVVANGGYRFDERLALSGGEDSLFFGQLTRAGHSIIWVNEALVTEYVSKERMTARWLLRRSFHQGTLASFVDLELRPGTVTWFVRLVKGLGRMMHGILSLPALLVMGRRGVIGSLRWLCYGAGVVSGLFGFVYQGYRKPT